MPTGAVMIRLLRSGDRSMMRMSRIVEPSMSPVMIVVSSYLLTDRGSSSTAGFVYSIRL